MVKYYDKEIDEFDLLRLSDDELVKSLEDGAYSVINGDMHIMTGKGGVIDYLNQIKILLKDGIPSR